MIFDGLDLLFLAATAYGLAVILSVFHPRGS